MTNITKADLAVAAFRLALRRLAVFPLAVGAKIPAAGSHGYLDASTDPDMARSQWAREPLANIGIATGAKSGFWVLDVDPRHGGDTALANLETENAQLPLTIEVLTPNGGRHFYFRWLASGPEIRNSASRVGLGLDVRGEGGSVVAPPSVLRNGRRYRWARNSAREFADAPTWLIELTQLPPLPPRTEPIEPPENLERYVAAALISEFRRFEETPKGQRNDSLNRAAFAVGQFVGCGAVPMDWAEAELERRAIGIGLSAIEAKRTILSGIEAGQRHPREFPQ